MHVPFHIYCCGNHASQKSIPDSYKEYKWQFVTPDLIMKLHCKRITCYVYLFPFIHKLAEYVYPSMLTLLTSLIHSQCPQLGETVPPIHIILSVHSYALTTIRNILHNISSFRNIFHELQIMKENGKVFLLDVQNTCQTYQFSTLTTTSLLSYLSHCTVPSLEVHITDFRNKFLAVL